MKVKFVTAVLLASAGLKSSPEQVIAAANKDASLKPTRKNFFNAGMIFDWEQGRLYQVYTQSERIPDIAFEVGENILSIGGGDSQRWTINQIQSGKDQSLQQHIFVNPHQMDISTNLVVTTDRRSYHLEIQVVSHVPYQALVSWKYPTSMK